MNPDTKRTLYVSDQRWSKDVGSISSVPRMWLNKILKCPYENTTLTYVTYAPSTRPKRRQEDYLSPHVDRGWLGLVRPNFPKPSPVGLHCLLLRSIYNQQKVREVPFRGSRLETFRHSETLSRGVFRVDLPVIPYDK